MTARDYATQRVTFGHPIGQNQAIGFMLADMRAAVDASGRPLARQPAPPGVPLRWGR